MTLESKAPTRPVTKLSRLVAAWESGDKIGALRIAAKFGDLGEQADSISRGWDAYLRPSFYRACKRDPEALTAAALDALAARYGLVRP